MSVSVPVSYLYNRNDKFELFLRRCLTQEQFERIRGYERCIVCDGKKLNRAFSFFVVSDKSIFITENPPKSILLNVSLTSLTQCEIIDDFPEFLDANLTHTSTHMQIKYFEPSKSDNELDPASESNKSDTVNEGKVQSKNSESGTRRIFANIFSRSISKKANIYTKTDEELTETNTVEDDVIEKKENSHSDGEVKPRRRQRKRKQDKNMEQVLDVYFLTNITPLCLLTKLSWNNSLITTSLEMGDKFSESKVDNNSSVFEFGSTGSVLHHFDLNMKRLVSAVNSDNLEEYTKFAEKFDNLAYHSYALRRLFWKGDYNVIALTKCTELFANGIGLGVRDISKGNLFQKGWNTNVLNLKLRCLSATLHLLATFFNETEILQSRTEILSESKSNVVVKLIGIISNAVAYASEYLFFNKGRWTSAATDRSATVNLFQDLLTAAAALIYEILLSGQALVHHSESSHFYNMRYLISVFEQSPRSNDAVYALAYDAINSLSFIPPAQPLKRGENGDVDLSTKSVQVCEQPPRMSSSRAVETYRELYIIDMFISHSRQFATVVQSKLVEEFKYFVNFSTAAAVIGSDYPICALLFNTLVSVKNQTLAKRVWLRS